MIHLYWNKSRLTTLRSKIEALTDDHPTKPKCLLQLALLFEDAGNFAEQKRLIAYALGLERLRKDDAQLSAILRGLSNANRLLQLYEEGIQQAKEALEISERIGDTIGQAWCLQVLAYALVGGGQHNAAKNAASRAVDLIANEDQGYLLSQLHRVLGEISRFTGEREGAIHHYETSLRIASLFGWQETLCWTHYEMAQFFDDAGELEDANTHIELAKSHAADGALPYELARAMELQAQFWHQQLRLEDAQSEALRSLEIYEKLGDAEGARGSEDLLQEIQRAMEERTTRPPGEPLSKRPHSTPVNFPSIT